MNKKIKETENLMAVHTRTFQRKRNNTNCISNNNCCFTNSSRNKFELSTW